MSVDRYWVDPSIVTKIGTRTTADVGKYRMVMESDYQSLESQLQAKTEEAERLREALEKIVIKNGYDGTSRLCIESMINIAKQALGGGDE